MIDDSVFRGHADQADPPLVEDVSEEIQIRSGSRLFWDEEIGDFHIGLCCFDIQRRSVNAKVDSPVTQGNHCCQVVQIEIAEEFRHCRFSHRPGSVSVAAGLIAVHSSPGDGVIGQISESSDVVNNILFSAVELNDRQLFDFDVVI